MIGEVNKPNTCEGRLDLFTNPLPFCLAGFSGQPTKTYESYTRVTRELHESYKRVTEELHELQKSYRRITEVTGELQKLQELQKSRECR